MRKGAEKGTREGGKPETDGYETPIQADRSEGMGHVLGITGRGREEQERHFSTAADTTDGSLLPLLLLPSPLAFLLLDAVGYSPQKQVPKGGYTNSAGISVFLKFRLGMGKDTGTVSGQKNRIV